MPGLPEPDVHGNVHANADDHVDGGGFASDAATDRDADIQAHDGAGELFVGVASLNMAYLNPVVLSNPAVDFGDGTAGLDYVVGDFNGDGYDDLVGLNGNATVFLSTGDGNQFGAALDFGPIISGGAGQVAAVRTR